MEENGDQSSKGALKKSWHERMQQLFWMMEKVQIGEQMNADCRKESQMYGINILQLQKGGETVVQWKMNMKKRLIVGCP